MARNEEKQQGRLNRLWLQKEKEEGRIKVHEQRPKLSTLNSSSTVKKWIPSIKSEIEYYLQQSQLSHYPERKIAEFQLCIDALEKEYKRFITKLRILDPSCKHKPWTPRAYAKRRKDTPDSPSSVKKPRYCEPHGGGGPLSDLACERTESYAASADGKTGHHNQPEAEPRAPVTPSPTPPEPPRLVCADQDQPLSFDRTRLAVAVAGFRGPVAQPDLSHTHSLVRTLQSGLPNLYNPILGQTILDQRRDISEETAIGDISGQKGEVTEQNPGSDCTTGGGTKSCISGMMEPGNVLGLGCYSSSDEDSDT